MRPIVRRAATLLAAPALAVTVLGVGSAPASAAVDPAPEAASATWLTSQLTDGLIHNDQYAFDDLGLSADVAFGLAAVGGHEETVADIVAAIAPRAQAEWYTSTFEGVTTTYAGSLAKATALAVTAGVDPTDFGGQDLVALLEGTLSTEGATAGRVQDDNNAFGDTNAIGQAYAAQALDAVNSPSTDAVTDFLLAQQCDAGWFRLDFAERDAADQTCDADPAAAPDTDVTAIAVLALQSQADDTEVAAHLDQAEAWLLDAQRADGSFGGGPTTEAPNANSTGLAGWALGELGDTQAATDAAAWVRAHQATDVANCMYYAAADVGAIAYDDAARTALQSSVIDPTTQDQFRRATSQALPVLQWAPAGSGDPQALFTAEYVKAGGKKPVGVSGAAPGEALCAMLGEQSVLGYANADGEATLPVLIPGRTATSKVRVANIDGAIGTATINALGAKKLGVTLKSKVAKGKQQVVKVTGLAPAETVSVRLGGKRVANGQANGKGAFTASFKVTGKPGKAKVAVTGQFANRKASKTFTVTR